MRVSRRRRLTLRLQSTILVGLLVYRDPLRGCDKTRGRCMGQEVSFKCYNQTRGSRRSFEVSKDVLHG